MKPNSTYVCVVLLLVVALFATTVAVSSLAVAHGRHAAAASSGLMGASPVAVAEYTQADATATVTTTPESRPSCSTGNPGGC